MSKYQNIQILKLAIAAALNGKDELALLLTGSKKSWIYQLLSFIVSSRYFVDQESIYPDWEIYCSTNQEFFQLS